MPLGRRSAAARTWRLRASAARARRGHAREVGEGSRTRLARLPDRLGQRSRSRALHAGVLTTRSVSTDAIDDLAYDEARSLRVLGTRGVSTCRCRSIRCSVADGGPQNDRLVWGRVASSHEVHREGLRRTSPRTVRCRRASFRRRASRRATGGAGRTASAPSRPCSGWAGSPSPGRRNFARLYDITGARDPEGVLRCEAPVPDDGRSSCWFSRRRRSGSARPRTSPGTSTSRRGGTGRGEGQARVAAHAADRRARR